MNWLEQTIKTGLVLAGMLVLYATIGNIVDKVQAAPSTIHDSK